MILAQQVIADAAVAAAARADAAWVKASQEMSLYNLLAASGWSGPKIAQYIGGGYSQQPGPRPGGGTSFAEGGPVTRTGLALVHAGEYVIPASMARNFSYSPAYSGAGVSGGGQDLHVHVTMQMDGWKMAGALMPHIVNRIRLHTGETNI